VAEFRIDLQCSVGLCADEMVIGPAAQVELQDIVAVIPAGEPPGSVSLDRRCDRQVTVVAP